MGVIDAVIDAITKIGLARSAEKHSDAAEQQRVENERANKAAEDAKILAEKRRAAYQPLLEASKLALSVRDTATIMSHYETFAKAQPAAELIASDKARRSIASLAAAIVDWGSHPSDAVMLSRDIDSAARASLKARDTLVDARKEFEAIARADGHVL